MGNLRRLAWVLWIPVGGLGVWQALAQFGVLDPLFFPPPSDIVRVGAGMAANGELAKALGSTLRNMLLGYIAGCSTGLACGLVMGRYPAVRRSLETIIATLYSTPKLSLFPLLLLLLGVNDAPRILITAIACFIVLAFHGQDAVGAVGQTYPEVAAIYGATPSLLVSKVYIPAALPTLFTGLRLAVGRGHGRGDFCGNGQPYPGPGRSDLAAVAELRGRKIVRGRGCCRIVGHNSSMCRCVGWRSG